MRFVLYSSSYSPHELPFYRAASEVFEDSCYVVDEDWPGYVSRGGWKPDLSGLKTLVLSTLPDSERHNRMRQLLGANTVIMYGTRGNSYEEEICSSGAIIIYASERWLKPLRFLPSIIRVFRPSFVRSLLKLRKWITTNPRFYYFGYGVHAIDDMSRLLGWSPVECDHVPCGLVRNENGELGRMRLWGYYVEPSKDSLLRAPIGERDARKILWVGRCLKLKRVDTLIRAISLCKGKRTVELTIVGEGPARQSLEHLANKLGVNAKFLNFQPIEEVRKLMRTHDMYVLPSSGCEGWGAVVNEALEENMIVLASCESGAGSTILPRQYRFRAGDVSELADKIMNTNTRIGIGCWTPTFAAKRLKEFVEQVAK